MCLLGAETDSQRRPSLYSDLLLLSSRVIPSFNSLFGSFAPFCLAPLCYSRCLFVLDLLSRLLLLLFIGPFSSSHLMTLLFKISLFLPCSKQKEVKWWHAMLLRNKKQSCSQPKTKSVESGKEPRTSERMRRQKREVSLWPAFSRFLSLFFLFLLFFTQSLARYCPSSFGRTQKTVWVFSSYPLLPSRLLCFLVS